MDNWIANRELALLRSREVADAAERERKLRGLEYNLEQQRAAKERRGWRRLLRLRRSPSNS